MHGEYDPLGSAPLSEVIVDDRHGTRPINGKVPWARGGADTRVLARHFVKE